MAKKEIESVFTKEQILKSRTFCEYRDLLAAVLKDDKTYTKEQVKKEITKFINNKKG